MDKRTAAAATVNAAIETIRGLDLGSVKTVKGYGVANMYANRSIDALEKLADQLTRCPEWEEK